VPTTPATNRRGDRYFFELLALQLYVHGPTAATLRNVRPLARTPLWLEVRCLLKEHGFTEAEIAHLTGKHVLGCPCWECIKRLRDRIRAHQRKLRRKAKGPLG
jgi:hypothetical protein